MAVARLRKGTVSDSAPSCSFSYRLTLGRGSVACRDGLGVPASIRLGVDVGWHSVRLRGAVCHGHRRTSHLDGSVSTTAEARRTSSSAASGTSVRGLVNTDLTAVESGEGSENCKVKGGVVWGTKVLDVVHRRDGFLGVVWVGVSDETEASTTASVAIFDNNLEEERLETRVFAVFLTLPSTNAQGRW